MPQTLFSGSYFLDSDGVGVDGLTVLVNVEQISRAGAVVHLVTEAAAIPVGRNGLYIYLVAAAEQPDYFYIVTFLTDSGDVAIKQQSVQATLMAGDYDEQLAYLTGNTYDRLGNPDGASIAADIAALQAVADDIFEDTDAQLTQQDVADALKLAPGAGDPAAGSVYDGLNDLVAASAAQLTQQDVADALKLAPTAGTPADGSVYDELGDLATALDGVSIIPSGSAPLPGTLPIIRGDTLVANFTLGDISDRAWLYCTAKYSDLDPDARAIFKVEETAGLMVIAGTVAGTPANGSIVVSNENTGATTLTIAAGETAKLLKAAKNAVYDWRLKTAAGVVRSLGKDKAVITLDVTQET